MKKYIFFCFAFIFTQTIFAQDRAINRFLDKQPDPCTMDLSIPAWLMRTGVNLAKLADDDKDLEDIHIEAALDKIKGMRVVIFDEERKVPQASVNRLISDLKKDDFEELMVVREGKNRINIFVKDTKDVIRNLFMVIVSEDGETILLDLKGRFTIEDINKIVRQSQSNDI